jgi:hypothetical protein
MHRAAPDGERASLRYGDRVATELDVKHRDWIGLHVGARLVAEHDGGRLRRIGISHEICVCSMASIASAKSCAV